MIIIGIILLLLGLVLAAYIVAGGLPLTDATEVSFSLFGLMLDTSAVVVFALGALTLLLLQLGLLALRSGMRKSARRRAELQRLRRVEAEVQSRQASDAQRNADTTASSAPAASPAPFSRRDSVAAERPAPVRPSSSDRPPGDGTTSHSTTDGTSSHGISSHSTSSDGPSTDGPSTSGPTSSDNPRPTPAVRPDDTTRVDRP